MKRKYMEKLDIDMISDLYNSPFTKEIERSIRRNIVCGYKQFDISFPALTSELFLIENFVWCIMYDLYVHTPFWGKINRSINESINHAILLINEKDSEEKVKVIATKTDKQFKVAILCGKKSLSPKLCDFNPPLPTDDKDLKGRSLYLMKNLTDKVDFFDDGVEVHLTFNI